MRIDHVLCLFVIVATQAHTLPTSQAQQRAQMSVMIVGDSISQGWEGDWTWRYRFWEWSQSERLDLNFVGPYIGTFAATPSSAPTTPLLAGSTPSNGLTLSTDGGYAVGVTPGWQSNHFAHWGRQCAQDVALIKGFVAIYRPDLLLVELGFNDLAWFSEAQEVLDCMANFITNARSGRADLKLAISNIPHRSSIEGREDLPRKTALYNELLANAIGAWTTLVSPIVYVDIDGMYECNSTACPAGHDGLHPNALGEYQIASAFSQALVSELSLGNSPLSVPPDIPARPCPVPSNVITTTSPDSLTVTWDAVYGAFGFDIKSTLVTLVGSNSTGQFFTTTNQYRWNTTGPLNGSEWQFQVRTNNGDIGISDWSAIVSTGNNTTLSTQDATDTFRKTQTRKYSDTTLKYCMVVYDISIPLFVSFLHLFAW